MLTLHQMNINNFTFCMFLYKTGKPSYFLWLVSESFYGIKNWTLVKEMGLRIRNLARYASFKDKNGYCCLQYCINADKETVLDIFDLIVKLYDAYPGAMRNNTKWSEDPNLSNLVGIQVPDDWGTLIEKVEGLNVYEDMLDLKKKLTRMKQFVEALSCCIVPTRGSFVVS